MKIRASKIFGKNVILDVGVFVGHLHDLKFNEKTGEVYALVIKPENMPKEFKKMFHWEGDYIIIPSTTLKNIGDFIVIDKNKLSMYKI